MNRIKTQPLRVDMPTAAGQATQEFSEIQEQINELHRTIDIIGSVSNVLIERLHQGGVLKEVPPQPLGDSVERSLDCPMSNRLRAMSNDLRATINNLSQTIDRLGV